MKTNDKDKRNSVDHVIHQVSFVSLQNTARILNSYPLPSLPASCGFAPRMFDLISWKDLFCFVDFILPHTLQTSPTDEGVRWRTGSEVSIPQDFIEESRKFHHPSLFGKYHQTLQTLKPFRWTSSQSVLIWSSCEYLLMSSSVPDSVIAILHV